MKKIAIVLIPLFLLGIFGLGAFWYFYLNRPKPEPPVVVKTYDECIKIKGSVIQESYPQVCTTPDGKSFTNTVPPIEVPLDPTATPEKMNSVWEMLQNTNEGTKKVISGTLVKGNQIDRGYCAGGIYLKDSSGKIQLRAKGFSGEIKLYSDVSFLDKPVTITGIYPTNKARCEAQICECDDYFLLEKVDLAL